MGRIPFDTIIVINLDRRKEKFDRVSQRIKSLNLTNTVKVIRLSAVDGENITSEWLENNSYNLLENYYDPAKGRGITYGEIGCAISHSMAWDMVNKREDIQTALIIEDDAFFSPNFVEQIEGISNGLELNEWDYVYLGRKKIDKRKEISVYPGLVKPYFSYWCLAYLLNKRGAEKLVGSNFKHNIIPVDEFIPIMMNTPNPNLSYMSMIYESNKKIQALSVDTDVIQPENFAFDNSDTEKTKVYFKNNSYYDGIDNFVVITVATEENESLSRFKKSCEYYNIPYIILGIGDKWNSGRAENGVLLEPGGAQKINYLKKELSTWENLSDNIILFTDSYDVIFTSPPIEILTKFRNFKKPIVFSAEKTCWPDVDIEHMYPKTDGEYKFLNSGGFIGYGDKILQLISEEVDNSEDDQRYYTKKFLENGTFIPEVTKFGGVNHNKYYKHENSMPLGWMSEPHFDDDVLNHLKSMFSPDAKVLDIGGGDGKWGMLLGGYFRHIDCVEIFEPYLERYNLNEIYNNVYLQNFLDFDFDYYDVVIMGDVFEHVTQEDASRWLNRISNKVGELVIVVPFEYKQDWDGVYENVYGHHHQPDLTPQNMLSRYPILKILKWTDQVASSNVGKGCGWFGKKQNGDTNQDIILDYKQSIFQTLNLAIDDVEVDKKFGRVKNIVTKQTPCVIHANGPSNVKEYLSTMSNFLFGQYDETYGSFSSLNKESFPEDKTISINIMLDINVTDINQVFDQIRYMVYPKNNIDLNLYYKDEVHEYKIDKFINGFKSAYKSINKVYLNLNRAELRNNAIEYSINQNNDYCLIMDCNYVFRNRKGIQFLLGEDKNIITPMIKEENTTWVNFSLITNDTGFNMSINEDTSIAEYENRGCWNVAYTAGIWMIKNQSLNIINGMFTNVDSNLNEDDDYDVIFGLNLKKSGITQHLSNNFYYGGIIP